MNVPYFDLKVQYASLRQEFLEALDHVRKNSSFILGEEVNKFEQEFAAYCEAKHCIALNTGTSALHLALLRACGTLAVQLALLELSHFVNQVERDAENQKTAKAVSKRDKQFPQEITIEQAHASHSLASPPRQRKPADSTCGRLELAVPTRRGQQMPGEADVPLRAGRCHHRQRPTGGSVPSSDVRCSSAAHEVA